MKILVSFSGGRSSARMVELVRGMYPDAELRFVFMNTGQEHWKTLEFVRRCDEHFGLNLVYLEAVVYPGKKSSGFRQVSYNELCRDDRIFKRMIEKYGIPNLDFPHCTRELKTNPCKAYIRSIGWNGCAIALGIRSDEPHRIGADPRFVYPLAEAGITKDDVIDYWRSMPFDLGIEEREGNCLWCWKKSEKKHVLNIQRNPEWYDVPERFEEAYAYQRTDLRPDPRVFFRGNRTTKDMRRLAAALGTIDLRHDRDGSICAESCEVF